MNHSIMESQWQMTFALATCTGAFYWEAVPAYSCDRVVMYLWARSLDSWKRIHSSLMERWPKQRSSIAMHWRLTALHFGLTQHINFVRLLGYCIQGLNHMLGYEYMSNKSLDQWLLHNKPLRRNKWVFIVIGVVQGLAYLHHNCNHNCNPAIIHLDIKPENIIGWFWVKQNSKCHPLKCGMGLPIFSHLLIMCIVGQSNGSFWKRKKNCACTPSLINRSMNKY
jgi:hypothetical protein